MKLSALMVRLSAAAFLLIAPRAGAADLCNNTNGEVVQNQPSARNMACAFPTPVRVTQIVTYHWNNGRGKLPGTLGLKSNTTGQTYGPFPAIGSSGQGGAPNVNWTANVNLCLPAGSYLILDSDWPTWSMNARSAYRGFVILRGEPNGCSPRGIVQPTPVTPVKPLNPPAKPNPQPTNPKSPAPVTPSPINLPPQPAKNPSIKCFLNSGAAAPKTTPCKGPAGTVLGVFLPTTQLHYTTMVFKAYGFPSQTAPLQGSGPIRSASAPQSLCIFPAPNIQTASGLKPPSPPVAIWEVYVEGSGVPPIGPVGGFSITGCGGKLPSVLPAAQPFPGGNPPPGLRSIKPCYVNSYAIASVGPCFGTPGTTLAVQIYNQKRGPFSILVFKTVVINGVPALVTAPLSGSGNLLMATAPIQLCLAKAPNKWQVWLSGPTKSLGQIGEFSVTGCP